MVVSFGQYGTIKLSNDEYGDGSRFDQRDVRIEPSIRKLGLS